MACTFRLAMTLALGGVARERRQIGCANPACPDHAPQLAHANARHSGLTLVATRPDLPIGLELRNGELFVLAIPPLADQPPAAVAVAPQPAIYTPAFPS